MIQLGLHCSEIVRGDHVAEITAAVVERGVNIQVSFTLARIYLVTFYECRLLLFIVNGIILNIIL